MSLSCPSHSHQAATTPSDFPYFQSLPSELQLMVWEEFLRAADRNKPRVVLMGARPSTAADLGPFADEFPEGDWSWCLEVDNFEPLRADPRSDVAQGLLALCWSSRHVATRFLDAPWASRVHLYLGRDLFWLPDDLVRYMRTIDDRSFRRAPDGCWVTFSNSDGIEPDRYIMGCNLLENVKYPIISLFAIEQALLWASPTYEWRGDVDIETFQRQKNCISQLFIEFGGFPNLIVMVGAPRGHVSWSKLRIVDAEDPALCEVGAREDPDRCLSVFRNYKTLLERFRRRLMRRVLDDGDHLVPVTALELPWWMNEAPKFSFAFQKP